MTLPVKFGGDQVPAHLQSRLSRQATTSELGGGVTSGFPVLSYRGKVWRIQKGGQEVAYLDAEGSPIPSVELVLIRAKDRPSKIFYESAYTEGSNEPPRCWSADGIKPDASVNNPVNPNCASCPNNVWGSRITEHGKKSRKCSDTRRMAVAFLSELQTKGADAHVFLMRVPPASLNPLKDYGEKVLGPKGVPFWSVATKIGFDPQAAHPKFTFRATRYLTEDEFSVVEQLRDGPDVKHILAESAEFGGEAGTTGGGEAAEPAKLAGSQKTTLAPAASRMRPVDDEDVPSVVAAAEEDDDQGEVALPVVQAPEPPPAPAAAPRVSKPRARKTAVQESTPPAAAAAPEVTNPIADPFDAMLSSILGD